jgi:hypothetical protein
MRTWGCLRVNSEAGVKDEAEANSEADALGRYTGLVADGSGSSPTTAPLSNAA